MIDLDELERLANAATPGPWVNPDGYCVRAEAVEDYRDALAAKEASKLAAENLARRGPDGAASPGDPQ